MLALREDLRDLVNIQIVAFPQDGILAYPQAFELMSEALRLGADLVGGEPYLPEREYRTGTISEDFE
jgi:cytosine deaminase